MMLSMVFCLLLPSQNGNEVYEAMLEKLHRAKTVSLKIRVEGSWRTDHGTTGWLSRLNLSLAEDNKVRLSVKTSCPEEEADTLYVSDGKTTRVAWKRAGSLQVQLKETPATLVSSIKEAILSGGPEAPLMSIFQEIVFSGRSPQQVTIKASIGDKERGVLEWMYGPDDLHLRPWGRSARVSATLHYDRKTLHPIDAIHHLHRVPGPRGCLPTGPEFLESWMTQTFEDYALDPVIGGDLFKLPEEKK